MGVNPKRGKGVSFRPLSQREIEYAQSQTKSGAEAARYLNVDYATYKKYAEIYGIFSHHRNQGGTGVQRTHKKGFHGIDEILAGKYPYYDKTKLKLRLIEAGYLAECCNLCGFNKQRVLDFRAPLILYCKDGNETNLSLENLILLCYNCSYLTTGRIAARYLLSKTTIDQDLLHGRRISKEEIEQIQKDALKEIDSES